MMPTLTASDPAIFPADVLAFAAEHGITDYLVPLYELARRCFDGVAVTARVEHDNEIPGMSWIVYEVPVATWESESYRAAHDRWLTAFGEQCPSELSINFVLGIR
jgi:hypothetical protein